MFLIIAYISIFSVFIPLVCSIIQWNKIPSDISALRWLLVAGVLSEALGLTLREFSISNLWVYDGFMFLQFSILLYIFSRQFERKAMLVIAFMGIGVFYLVALVYLTGSSVSLVRSNAVDGLVLVIVSLVFFYKLLTELKVIHIHRLPILWISFATLFYYSGNFFVFLASSYLEKDPETFFLFWTLHNVLNVIKNILFAVALWQSYRTMRSLT
jgi:hypothetical protein